MLSRVKETRVNNAYDRLKTDILFGVLQPGFQAPEPEIAARLEMSRTPVREALIRLETEGLVELIPRRGAKVLSVNAQDLTDIMEILSVLEPLAVATITKRGLTPEASSELSVALDAAAAAAEDDDLSSWAEHDDRFHRLLGKWSNRRLEREIGLYLDQVHRAVRVLVRLNGTFLVQQPDQRLLLNAMISGECEKAAGLARENRLSTLSSMCQVFESSGVTHL